MRNQPPAEVVEVIGNLPHHHRHVLMTWMEAWYKSEQQKLTYVHEDAQLRQAQGAAQILEDISKVLTKPEAYRSVPGSARRSDMP